MNVRIETRFENLNVEVWNRLAAQSEVNTVFQTHEWHAAWLKAFGGDKELFILVAEENGEIVGIAPFMIASVGKRKVLRFIGHGRADYCNAIYPRERMDIPAAFFQVAKENRDLWHEIELVNVPSYAATVEVSERALKELKRPFFKTTALCPVLTIKESPNLAKAVASKKKLEQYRHHYVKQGGYVVENVTDEKKVLALLGTFFDQHILRWSTTSTPSLFLSEDNRAFYIELTKRLAAKGWLIFTVIRSQGIPIAFHFGFSYANKFLFYKPTFDIDQFKHSPGLVLLKELFNMAIAKGFHEFDFSSGEEAYKQRFSNLTRKNFSFRIFKRRRDYWVANSIRMVEQLPGGRALSGFVREMRDQALPEMRDAIARYGFIRSLGKGLRIFFQNVVFRYGHILFFELHPDLESKADPLKGIEAPVLREADIKDFSKLNIFSSDANKRRFLAQAFDRFKRGHRALIAELDGKIVFMAWVHEMGLIDITEVRTKVSVGENALTIYDCVTVPEFRGRGIYPFMLGKIADMYLGKKKVIYCESGNGPSRKGIERAGFTVKRDYQLLFILGLNLRWSRDG